VIYTPATLDYEKGDTLDIAEILIELREERARFDKAIKALEALETSRRDPVRVTGKKRKSNPRSQTNHLNRIAHSTQTLAEVIPFRRFGS
jgi:hypothetical protein